MDRDLWRKLLDRAHERYETALRWGGVLLAALMLFHVAIYERYLSLTRSLASTAELRKPAEVRLETLGRLSDGLRKFQDKATPNFAPHFDSLRDQLVADFRYLQSQLEGPPPEATSARPGPPGPPPPFPGIQMQMPLPAALPPLPAARLPSPSFPPPTFALPEAERARLRGTFGSEGDLIEAARPIVGRYILAPRFRQLADLWRREVVEPAGEERRRIQGILAEAPFGGPADRELVLLRSKIEQGTSEAMQGLAAVRFTPPEGAWWRSVRGKGAVATTGAAALTAEIERVSEALLRARPELEGVRRRVEAIVNAHATALADLEKRLRDVQKEFNELQGRLGELTKPVPWIPLPLEQAVGWFPLLLGLALGAVTEFVALRLGRLVTIARVEGGRGDDADLLRAFYFGGASRWLAPATAAVGGVGLVWVAYTVWRLGTMTGAGSGPLLGQALVGGASLVAATVHHAVVRRRVTGAL